MKQRTLAAHGGFERYAIGGWAELTGSKALDLSAFALSSTESFFVIGIRDTLGLDKSGVSSFSEQHAVQLRRGKILVGPHHQC
jgi:hypothetical protein